MRKDATRRITMGILLLLAIAAAPLAGEMITCAECGMLVDETALFSAKIIKGKQVLYFCDIGDLLLYVREKKESEENCRVKDYPSGEWINAAKAFFVHAPGRFTTPMGWSIAGFKERTVAEGYGVPADMATISKRVIK